MTARILLAAFMTVLPSVPVQGQIDPGSAGLTISWSKRFLEVKAPATPSGPIRTHYLEAYCRPVSTDRDWNETVISHESRLVSASADEKHIEIEDHLRDGVVVSHVITAGEDEVTFLVKASNPSQTESMVHWAQPCMRVHRFTGSDRALSRKLFPPYLRKYFLMIDGRLTRLPTDPWALRVRYTPSIGLCSCRRGSR